MVLKDIDFNNVWKNIEFSLKGNAKRVLEKNFIENIDYKKAAPHLGGASFINENKNLLVIWNKRV